MVGPPGSGKGTQGKRLAADLHIPTISTGDLLREKKNDNSPLGRELKEIMAQGKLVPDDVIVGMIRERVQQADCSDGFILDGFPRTVAQADALDEMLENMNLRLSAVLHLEVDTDQLVRRLTGRRICANCGTEYHIEFKPPAQPGVCDKCGGDLIQREDDQEATIRNRLAVYSEQTRPLVDYYARKGLLKSVDGLGSFDEVYARLRSALGI